MNPTVNTMLTTPQAAKLLGVNADKIRAWIACGELPAVNVVLAHGLTRPRWRIAEADLDAFKQRRAAQPGIRKTRRPRPPAPADCPDYCSMILRGERWQRARSEHARRPA